MDFIRGAESIFGSYSTYIPMKSIILGILIILVFAGELGAQQATAPAGTENVLVYPSITVAVNKAVILHLPKNATKVAVTQPNIAEVVVVTPDTLLINGRAVGATSLVVWLDEKTKSPK
jgi:Flp pilus assembly secretin CpaC